MPIYKKGDILQSTENIICHQCNTQGTFGGGLAYQIKQSYPNVELEAMKNNIKGCYYLSKIDENKYIANCFSQNEDYSTNYNDLYDIFDNLLKKCKYMNYTICVPYKYGCGIANGDWNIVENIFKKLSEKYNVDIVIYKLEVK